MGLTPLIDILHILKEFLSLTERTGTNKAKVTEGLVRLQVAIIETRNFITDNGYTSNPNLSKLWLSAFEKIEEAEIYPRNEFPDYLYYKAKFWGNPSIWLKEPTAMELVPTLDNLNEKADSILVKIRNT